MSEDDDGPPLLDVLGSDAMGDVIGSEARHGQGVASLDSDLSQRCCHTNGFEGKLQDV